MPTKTSTDYRNYKSWKAEKDRKEAVKKKKATKKKAIKKKPKKKKAIKKKAPSKSTPTNKELLNMVDERKLGKGANVSNKGRKTKR